MMSSSSSNAYHWTTNELLEYIEHHSKELFAGDLSSSDRLLDRLLTEGISGEELSFFTMDFMKEILGIEQTGPRLRLMKLIRSLTNNNNNNNTASPPIPPLPSNLQSIDPTRWSIDDVSRWLQSLGPRLSDDGETRNKTIEILKKERFDGSTLFELDDDILKSDEIKFSFGIRHRLLKRIKELKTPTIIPNTSPSSISTTVSAAPAPLPVTPSSVRSESIQRIPSVSAVIAPLSTISLSNSSAVHHSYSSTPVTPSIPPITPPVSSFNSMPPPSSAYSFSMPPPPSYHQIEGQSSSIAPSYIPEYAHNHQQGEIGERSSLPPPPGFSQPHPRSNQPSAFNYLSTIPPTSSLSAPPPPSASVTTSAQKLPSNENQTMNLHSSTSQSISSTSFPSSSSTSSSSSSEPLYAYRTRCIFDDCDGLCGKGHHDRELFCRACDAVGHEDDQHDDEKGCKVCKRSHRLRDCNYKIAYCPDYFGKGKCKKGVVCHFLHKLKEARCKFCKNLGHSYSLCAEAGSVCSNCGSSDHTRLNAIVCPAHPSYRRPAFQRMRKTVKIVQKKIGNVIIPEIRYYSWTNGDEPSFADLKEIAENMDD